MAKAQVEQIEKDKAKAAIDKAAEEANALIDGLKWDATNAKDQAEKAKAQAAIQNDVDQAKQKIQNGSLAEVPGNRDEGIAQIQRDAAKAAIDKAVAEAQDKLAKDSNIPDGDKSKAEAAINDAGKQANEKIDGQTDKDAINDAKKNGLNDVQEASQAAAENGQKKADPKQAVKDAADKANEYIDQLKLNEEDQAKAKGNITNDVNKAMRTLT
ncbi:DUF1542 domain-containing protein [Fructobacillus sp. CRL 2054]|uniref:DUF1542 domain-containing protein n=1 Tax=Fructobacillus sp. CRL 2054 TaxID=2763007 RepID=UPI0023785828|nr:DUF1542 domain-containing protein [Fructobacillus sp. CRL 2054]